MRRAILSGTICLGLLAFLATPAVAAPGDLDPSFGVGGLVRSDITLRSDSAIGMAIQADGKIVAVGAAGAPNSKFAVARYNTDGTLDTTFGSGTGKVLTDITGYRDAAISVAIQGDGKIVVSGGMAINGPNAGWAVVRYDSVGTLDTSFGGGTGKVILNLSPYFDEPTGIGIQSTGRIVVSGGIAADGPNPDFGVVGLTTSGGLDGGFGTGGKVRTDFNNTSYDWGQGGLVVQPVDNKIVVGGYTINRSAPGNPLVAIARYTASGSLDTTFSGDGKFSTDFGPYADFLSWVTLDSTNNIVGAGEAGAAGPNPKAAVLRVTSLGILDPSFNNGTGKLTNDYGPKEDFAGGVAVDSGGNIVTAGGVGLGGPNPRFAVSRYLPTGTLDTSFGTGGNVFTDFGLHVDYANFVAVDGNGDIVADGTSGGGTANSKFALDRYLSA